MIIVRILKMLVGAVGFIWCMIPYVFSGVFNMGNLAGALFFGVLFWWGVLGKKLRELSEKKKVGKVITGILIAGYSLFTLLFAVESVFMINALNKEPPDDATLIVLGCAVYGETPSDMLSLRIDAAYEFLNENPDSKAVLAGGQGNNEDISEALCMKRELVKKGISEDRLYLEDKSVNTRENIAFSKDIIEEEGLNTDVAVVTNNFHIYRSSLSVKGTSLKFHSIPAYTPLPVLPTYIMREYLGIFPQWIKNLL